VSKAFTRESDESGAEETPLICPQLPPGTRNYITREGADRLRQHLNGLLARKQALMSASAAGTASGADQHKIESAIRRLQQTLDSVIVAEIPADHTKVAFGATVVIRHGDGEESAYQIVGVEEADPERGSISWLSPLARALLSRRAGDKVQFQSPAGGEELTILTVRYPPRAKAANNDRTPTSTSH
jgi:transcription elongation factor GreB